MGILVIETICVKSVSKILIIVVHGHDEYDDLIVCLHGVNQIIQFIDGIILNEINFHLVYSCSEVVLVDNVIGWWKIVSEIYLKS